ncbi:MAG: SUMF1/EgtB/PvdO family nonheme iron enzyme [Armatimonadetes bacterium]|nr:SUMF1/EgtB/PvdO family nonheme iron enzyme [Armatimonadota bacterium]
MRGLLGLLLAACVSHAAETYVVAVGVEKYDDERISALKYACADARSVAAVIRASGVPPKNVFVLASDSPLPTGKPTRIALIGALERVRERAVTGDKVVFFFAGHGVEEAGEQYLLTSDTRRNLVQDTALPLRLVGKALEGVQAGAVLFLIDACRNDPNAGRADADATLSEGLARGLRPLSLSPGGGRTVVVATLLACDVGQRAYEDPEQRHGAFSVYLLRGMSGEAKGPDGQVHLSGLADYVKREVVLWGQRTNHVQTPRLVNPEGGDVALLTPPAEPVVSVAFQNHTLAQVVDLLAEQYGAQVVLGKGVDAEAKVTGRLENQPLAATLQVLVAAHDLAVRREGKVYIVEAKGAAPESARPAAAPADIPGGVEFVRIPAGDGVAEFELGRTEVTVGQFREFVDATGYRTVAEQAGYATVASPGDAHRVPGLNWRHGWAANRPSPENYPVVNVALADVEAFAKWVGGRLPTHAEWSWAASGGHPEREYVWGSQWPPPPRSGNFADEDYRRAGGALQSIEGYDDGFAERAPVGWFNPNDFGLSDMAGNVYEWLADGLCWGGSYLNGIQTFLTLRGATDKRPMDYNLGFRVARNVPGSGARVGGTAQTDAPTKPANWPDYVAWPPVNTPGLQFRVREKDGMPQVLIPEGEFLMGSTPQQIDALLQPATPEQRGLYREQFLREAPQRRVRLSAFWADLHPVTVRQYSRFAEATGRGLPAPPPWGWQESHAMVNVSRADAEAYAGWSGAELPTEAQWEKAARAGREAECYPWGDQWEAGAPSSRGPETLPVCKGAANGYGLFDVLGNVWEMCRDYFQPDWYAKMPDRDPVGLLPSQMPLMRGGPWTRGKYLLRLAMRTGYAQDGRGDRTGFRCVNPAP